MILKKALFLLIPFTFLMSHGANAELATGQKLPHDLAVTDQHGKQKNFETLKGEKGLVLVFVRSADWCPFCKTQLVEMNQAYENIQKLGYEVASVSYDNVAALKAFNDKHGIAYPMLSDKGSEIINAFGILNEKMQRGTRFYGIPYPAVYVIGADGVVQAQLAEEGYKKRPPASLVIHTIKSISVN